MRFLLLVLACGVLALQPLPPPPLAPPATDPAPGLALASVPNTIYIHADLASRRDDGGLTLIPPSGHDFAAIFRDELTALTRQNWSLEIVESFAENDAGIFLDLFRGTPSTLAYENGQPTEEGYSLVIGRRDIRIAGSGARGMWWGSRTLLQQMMIANWTSLPVMNVTDAPSYATRGYMLDAGRKYYSPAFLKELCTYASFFKMSEFHYHMSDNYPLNRGHNETWNDVYSHFSLLPEDEGLAGIVQKANETLNKADFDDLQRHCVARGVTVIPEIEAPGHCLSITKWKPELALESKKDLLNLTHPDSIPTVKRIWAEFLPWFDSKEVHIGADEYDAALADDYIRFVNEMAAFVNETSGKAVRIWGTHEPSKNLTISKDVVVQHWQYGQSDPLALHRDDYDVINSGDWWAYMSLKNDHTPILPAPYPQFFNETRVLNFANEHGWQWQPALFNPVNKTEQLANGAGGNKGAIMAAWNDNGPDATTQLEAYYAMRRGIPLVAARAWSGSRGAPVDMATVEDSIDLLSPQAPGQNLDRQTDFTSWSRRPDDAGNSGVITLGHGSKGMDYTLTLSMTEPFTLSSDDVTLQLAEDGSLTFDADGWIYPLRSVDEKDGFDPGHPGRIWANSTHSSHQPVNISLPAEIVITGDVVGGSRVWVNGSFAGRFEVFVFGGKNTQFSWSQMAFVAPLESLSGGIQSIKLDATVNYPQGNGTALPSIPNWARSESRMPCRVRYQLLFILSLSVCLAF